MTLVVQDSDATLQRIGLRRSIVEAAIDEVRDRRLAASGSDSLEVNPVVASFVQATKPLLDAKIRQALRQELIELAAPRPGAPAAPSNRRSPVGSAMSKRRFAPWSGAVVAMAAVATAMVVTTASRPARPPLSAFAELKSRPYEIRLAYPDAAAYRPVRDSTRGASPPANEWVPFATLAAFQTRSDRYAFAIALAFDGENHRAARELDRLPQTPAVRGDRAAIELLTTSNEKMESVLSELETLQISADPAVAHATRWNYALALSHLDLPLSTGQAFRAIAADHEPGWADEAQARAEREIWRGRSFQTRWKIAAEAGEALLKAGTPVPVDLIAEFPGLMRRYLYDAVRTAPTRDRVVALIAMAAELDRVDGTHVLRHYVKRVAALDFRRRASLAAAYARLLRGVGPAEADMRALVTPTASSDVFDIVMGAMNQLDMVPDHLDEFRRMTQQAGDPWFEILLARAEATADIQHGDFLGAEARLRAAEKRCNSAIAYQCLGLRRQLGKLYQHLARVPEALEVLQIAARSARDLGEPGEYTRLLLQLADVEQFTSSTAITRAYVHEALLLTDRCDDKFRGHLLLASTAVLDLDGRVVRQHLAEALQCGKPDLRAANLLADISRLDPQAGDLAQLQTWASDLRTSASATSRTRVLIDEIEGRLLIEHDRAAGQALLRRAIAAADELPGDVEIDRVRASAYAVLAFDATRHDEAARALSLIAGDLGRLVPSRCAVGMAADSERAVTVVRDADGRDRMAYDPKRNRHSGPWIVSAALAQGLAACKHVQVMARAALQGQPRVLPAELPWSYAADARRRVSGDDSPAERHALVVSNVTPPAYLGLTPLLNQRVPGSSSATWLSADDATPTRVLMEMRRATEIQFHTHALMAGISDAPHLVLSSDASGRYALTAEAIRTTELRGHPIVVLAACNSARGAGYQHVSWSLPDAFLAAGARAVFAAATEIRDREAGPFFERVLVRMRAGADAAAALRDERMIMLASDPFGWAADVILFE